MNWRQIGSVIILAGFLTPSIAFSQATLTPIKDAKSGRTFAFKVEGARTLAAKPGTGAKVLSAKGLARQTAESFIADNKAVLGIKNPATDLVALPADVDEYGSRQKYLQLHKGVPVYAGELAVHMDRDGVVTYVKTKLTNELPPRVKPKISLKAANTKALRLAKLEAGRTKIRVSKSELIVLPLGMVLNEPQSNSHLVWKIEVLDSKPGHIDEGDEFGATYFIDAIGGQKLFRLANHADLTRQVYDSAGGNNANTIQLDVQDPSYPGYYHGRSEGMPVRGPYPNPNFPLFYGSNDVDNMYTYLGALDSYYNNTFGINGPNGLGGTAIYPTVSATLTRGLVHNDYTGFSPVCPFAAQFSFNTGSITFCRSVVVPDVVGHEYSHAIVQHSFHDGSGKAVGPTYYGESGALNEAFADVMGEIFEKYYTNLTDWKNRTANPTPPMPLRDLRNPPSLPQYQFGPMSPDRHNSDTYSCSIDDSGGVHDNSTVPSHAFYLISDGGQHNGCDIVGQGADVAQRIFFRGWRFYFSSNPTFNEAYADLMQACGDLYGTTVCAEVRKALQSVEMDQGGKCSGLVETAPACAVQLAGTQNTTYRQRNVTTVYAPNEQIWLSGAGGVPGKTFNVFVRPHAASIATWSAITDSPVASGTVGSDATSRLLVATAGAVGQFDLVIDGNSDGYYQPWADSVIPIEVKVPVAGDGACYRGDSYATSENCHDQASDCKCAAGWSCINGTFNPSNPFYMCYPTYFDQRS